MNFRKDVPEGFPTAMGDNVIIDVSHVAPQKSGTEYEETGAVGILIAKEKRQEDKIATSGIVLACGPDCETVSVGDRVVLPVATQALMAFSYEGQPKDRKFCRVFERNIPAVFKENVNG